MIEAADPDAAHVSKRLIAWLKARPLEAFTQGTVVDWALENCQLTALYAYIAPADHMLGQPTSTPTSTKNLLTNATGWEREMSQ